MARSKAAQIMADIDDHREMARRLLEERRGGESKGCGVVVPGVVHLSIEDCIDYERRVIERALCAYWAEIDDVSGGS